MKRLNFILCLLFLSSLVFSQRTIKGLVKDNTGEPLIGASIVAKGTDVGTVTDIDGAYSLNVPASVTILTFTYTGFTPQEIAIENLTEVNVSLQEGVEIQEIVVTAFGIKKDKSNLGYGVTQLTSSEITQAHTTNVTNALAAKVPGVRVSGSGGSFSSSSIIIRGYTSFTGSNQPLFVVDGISIDNSGGGNTLQTGVTNSGRAIDINQEDIESISVLKGAAATSLYGSRAANGVVLITTKTGKSKSKQSVTYSVNVAQQEVNRFPDYQNTYGQGNTGNFNPGAVASWGPKIDGRSVLLPIAYRGLGGPSDTSTSLTAYPNNVSDLFKKGLNTQHNLSFQGGANRTGYRLSLGYLDDNGVIDNNRLKRYNFGINSTTELTKKLSAGVSVNYALNKSNRTAQGNQLSNPLFRSWFTPRSWDLTGRPFQSPTGANLHYDAVDNPRWSIYNNLYNDQIDRVFGNFNLRYELNSWLRVSAKAGADNFAYSGSYYDQIGAAGQGATVAGGIGGIREIRQNSRIINSTFLITADKKVAPHVNLIFVLGNEILDQVNNSTDLIGRGVTVRNFRNLQANTTTLIPNNFNYWQYRLVGFFSNLTASYSDWATIDLAARNDNNSILPQANNSYTYYSVAGTLNLARAFKINSNLLSSLKLSGNTGLIGSAKSDFRYSTDSYYGKANLTDGFGPNVIFPFNGTLPGFTLQDAAGNPNLKPEFTRSTEGEIEIGFFNDKIKFSGIIYKQHTTDILLSVPNSPAAGISSVLKNAGSLTTNGKELQLTISPFKSNNGFNWSTVASYTQFKTIIDDLAPGVQKIQLGGFTTPGTFLVKGDEYGQIYGTGYLRNADGKMIVSATTGLPSPTPLDQKVGNPNPKYLLGISNAFSYKNLDLNVLIDIKEGGDQYSRNIADLQRNGVTAETAEFERLNSDGTPAKLYTFDAVTPAGTPNTIAVTAEQYWGNSGKYVAAEGYIYNTSWVRIREASIGYTFSKNMLKNTPIGDLTLSVFGRNLFLSSPGYPHLDPEQNVSGVSNSQGLEFNALPQTKSIGVNLKVTF
ncbi:MAG: SusC/RagA family TonB-linked outer membrane protein [Saprospiraceae bacterium]